MQERIAEFEQIEAENNRQEQEEIKKDDSKELTRSAAASQN